VAGTFLGAGAGVVFWWRGAKCPEDERGAWEFGVDNNKGTPDWESLLFL